MNKMEFESRFKTLEVTIATIRTDIASLTSRGAATEDIEALKKELKEKAEELKKLQNVKVKPRVEGWFKTLLDDDEEEEEVDDDDDES
jgi:uncharacterized coiled-coil protein SlyX